MKGTEWLKECPDDLVEAQDHIIDTVVSPPTYQKVVLLSWVPLEIRWNEHCAVIFVASRPLAIGTEDDYVTVCVTARTAQVLADRLRAVLPTTKIIDLIHERALQHQLPHTQPSNPQDRLKELLSPSMMDKGAMVYNSDVLRHALNQKYPGLADNCGKHWVLTNRLLAKPKRTAANYGWYSNGAPYVSASGYKMWQTIGTRHSDAHVDYSQIFQPVFEEMIVDGVVRKVWDVLADTELCHLISSEGPLSFLRYPVSEGPAPEPEPAPELDFERTLKLTTPRMCGDDVGIWQRFLVGQGYNLGPHGPAGDGVDDSFGGLTDGATRQFQRTHQDPMTGLNLVVDGVVGELTLRSARVVLGTHTGPAHYDPEPPRDEKLITDFKQAVNYTEIDPDTPRDIKWVVMHTAEMPEKPTAAEALGDWVSGPNAPRASWHYAVDADSIVASVLDKDVAWHAPGANRNGIGIEHAGYARQTMEEWFDEFSESMLRRSARLVARLCKEHGIPVQFIDEEGLKRGDRGITTHLAVSLAFRKSDHTDPGEMFPMDWFLKQVQLELG